MRAPQQRVPWRTTFNPDREFVVRRGPLTVGAGVTLKVGEAFPKSEVTLRRLRQLYDQRVIRYPDEDPGAHLAYDRRASGQAPVETAPGEPEPEPVADPRDAVEIPDNWAELPWPQRRSLAALLTDDKVVNGEDAEAAITAELARRAGG